jgi:DNA-binding CsgD family transcriptional regulator
MTQTAPSNMGEQVLLALGLHPVSVQVYLALHAEPAADTARLAQRLNLQVPEVVDALDELSDLTLLRPGLAPLVGRLRPVSIPRALHTLLRQQSEQLKAQTAALTTLQSAVAELLSTRPERSATLSQADVETHTGFPDVQTRLEELVVGTQESIYSMLPGGPIAKDVLDASRQGDKETAERGTKVRSLYQSSVQGDRRTMEYIRWLSGLGVEVRLTPIVPMRLLIIDHTVAVVGHNQNPLPYELFVVHEAGLVAPIHALFERTWDTAQPLEELDAKSTEPDARPGSQELALLRLLAAGGTDETAAKKLGVSVRTVRRIMADLMERLEASSRFEAGHKATQRGWL